MRNYKKLKEQVNAACDQVVEGAGNLRVMAKDAERVSLVAKNVHIVLQDIDRQFAQATKLNGVDIAFLFFATALQVARQYLVTNFKDRPDHDEAAKSTPGHTEEHSNRDHWAGRRLSAQEILNNPVPFDATFGSAELDLGIGGGFNHRASTLGHDPILGWIVGTANIATSTMTLWNLQSFHVETGHIATGAARDKITRPANTYKDVFSGTFDRLVHEGNDGIVAVGASLVKEALHLLSDVNSKESLPLPLVSVIASPAFAKQLANYGLDVANVSTVLAQAALASLINALVAMIHGLFYDEKSDGSWSLYEVRTRKILSYSNIIASVSNIIVTALTRDLKKLDVGGLLVTLWRIVSDIRFIEQIKKEFLEKEFYNTVMGPEFNF